MFGNGFFLASGPAGQLVTSVNGTNWFTRPAPSTSEYTLGFGSGRFFFIDQQHKVFTSVDASNWVGSGSVSVLRPSAFAYGNGHFVVGGGGSLEYSGEATNWTVSPTGYLYVTWGLTFGHDTFVPVASDGLNGKIKQSDPLVVALLSGAPRVLEIHGPPGKRYRVETLDLPIRESSWAMLTNFVLQTSPQLWQDTTTTAPSTRFIGQSWSLEGRRVHRKDAPGLRLISPGRS